MLPEMVPPVIVNVPSPYMYTPPPSRVAAAGALPTSREAVLPVMEPPDIVNVPSYTYTPPPASVVVLLEMVPPVIVNVPFTSTPEAYVEEFPEIAPPVIVNTPPALTSTPAPSYALPPPVMAPAPSTLLVSVRSPPAQTSMTPKCPAASIVWPFRSSVTAFETFSVASRAVAVTLLASVTVPPSFSCACSRSHAVGTRTRYMTPVVALTAKAGSSLKKYAPSSADVPEAIVTGEDRVGVSYVFTPMRVPAERPLEWNVRAQR